MKWMENFRATLRDELSPAAQRLLDAILDLAELRDDATNEWAASKDSVLSALEATEGKRLDGAACRQRLQTIRKAIDASDLLKIDGTAAVTIKSEKHCPR